PAYWAVVQGRLAGAHPETPTAVNPHRVPDVRGKRPPPSGTLSRALALCWDYGFAGMPRARPKPRDTVSRGTTLRPPRDDWRDHEIEVLRLARSGGQGHLSDRQLAVIVGKSHDAVRAKLARGRRLSERA
ncbi:hypothetical protein LCGC14_2595640, partial [marine sediment metagenome]